METTTTAEMVKLTTMARAYLECALFSTMDWDETATGNAESLDATYGVDDCSPKLKAQAQSDCDAFYADNEALLSTVEETLEQAGHDFWLSRNGHGAGFFDRGCEPEWRELQRAAKVWGSVDLYVGADGMIYPYGA